MNAMAQNQEFAVIAGPPSEWGVLTCSNAVTLRLAKVLNDSGFEAWAPKSRAVKRVGPARDRKASHEPIMPGFVFVASQHIWLLAQMAYSPAQQFQTWDEEKERMVATACPPFTVMRYEHDRQPFRVPDCGLNALRMHERANKPADEIKLFELGDKVRYSAAGFEGLTGVVETCNRKITAVAFSGAIAPVKIPTALLIAAH